MLCAVGGFTGIARLLEDADVDAVRLLTATEALATCAGGGVFVAAGDLAAVVPVALAGALFAAAAVVAAFGFAAVDVVLVAAAVVLATAPVDGFAAAAAGAFVDAVGVPSAV